MFLGRARVVFGTIRRNLVFVHFREVGADFGGCKAQGGADSDRAKSAMLRGFGGPFSRRPKKPVVRYGDTFGSERFRREGEIASEHDIFFSCKYSNT